MTLQNIFFNSEKKFKNDLKKKSRFNGVMRCDIRIIVVALTQLFFGGCDCSDCEITGGSRKKGWMGHSNPAAISVSYELPLMTVSSDGTNTCGNLVHEKFCFKRENHKEPFRIAISESMPLGSSDVIRSSVWKAAFVASLQSGSSLTGCSVELDLSGRVDGPSAGGIFCLAIMSAIEGRTLPADFCMTGTIFPDGTIGLVGGVAHKIRAAVREGKKRICIPAFLRFEEQENGEDVDLYTLCADEGVTVFPVATIEDAYAVAYGLPAPVNVVPSYSVGRLPRTTESLLISRYRAAKKQIPHKDYLGRILSVPFLENRTLLRCVQKNNEKVFDSGRILSATIEEELRASVVSAVPLYQKWEADVREKYPALLNLPPYLLKKSRLAFVDAVRKVSEEVLKTGRKGSYLNSPPIKGLSSISAQWDSLVDSPAYVQFIRELVKSYAMMAHKVSDDELSEIFRFLKASAFFLVCTRGSAEKEVELRKEFFGGFTNVVADTSRLAETEMMFYQGVSALHRSLAAEAAAHMGNSGKDAPFNETDFIVALTGIEKAHKLLEKCENNPDVEYGRVALLLSEADLMALEYSYTFQNSIDVKLLTDDFLGRIVRRARDNAVRNIDECQKLGIPCPAPAYKLEKGDSSCISSVRNLKDVLYLYWSAAMQAKVLTLVFEKGLK